MNANNIINEDMTLEEKLAAIDKAMQEAQVQHQKTNPGAAPLDPADLTQCEGCQ
jgi:hypothetical protein